MTARRVRGVAARPLRAVATLWRRSIQARVVLSTVLLSALVVSLVGWTLLRQVTDGLVQERVKEAVAESGRATEDLQVSLSAATPDFEASAQLASLMSTEISRGAVRGYDVVLVGPLSVDEEGRAYGGGERFTPGLDLVEPAARPHRAGRGAAGERPAVDLHPAAVRRQRRRSGRAGGAGDRRPGCRGRDPAGAARRRRHLRALPPLPDVGRAAHRSTWCSARSSPAGSSCSSWSRR